MSRRTYKNLPRKGTTNLAVKTYSAKSRQKSNAKHFYSPVFMKDIAVLEYSEVQYKVSPLGWRRINNA